MAQVLLYLDLSLQIALLERHLVLELLQLLRHGIDFVLEMSDYLAHDGSAACVILGVLEGLDALLVATINEAGFKRRNGSWLL